MTLRSSTSAGASAAQSRAMPIEPPLPRAAELLEHAQLGVAAAVRVQHHRQCLRAGPVGRQHDGVPAAAHRGVGVGGDQADHLGVLHRPAEPGAGQRHRGHVRQHPHPVRAEQPDQRAADRRAASGRRWPARGRRRSHRRAAPRVRATSATAIRADRRTRFRQEERVAARPENDCGPWQFGPGRRCQAGHPVGADTDNDDHRSPLLFAQALIVAAFATRTAAAAAYRRRTAAASTGTHTVRRPLASARAVAEAT